ncbi:MAG: prepilin-type N-terminal cleavage/methylation domain-containing protein [Phycisphaerae bacterium]
MSEAGGRLHATAGPAQGRSAAGARGFTLVELITVMAILGILVTLMVGAYQGVQRRAAIDATKEMLTALNTALRNFYDDFGYYPWHTDSGDYMGQVPNELEPILSGELREEAILYAALTARVRRGPYFKGGGAKTVLRVEGSNRFLVFGDGWGRPIQYRPPENDSTLPFLYSFGPDGEDNNGGNDDVSN